MTEDRVAPRTAAGLLLWEDHVDCMEGDPPEQQAFLDKILAIEAEAASLDRDEARYAAVMEDNVSLRADRDELRKAVEALLTRLEAAVNGMRAGTSRDERYDLGWDDACFHVLAALASEKPRAAAEPSWWLDNAEGAR